MKREKKVFIIKWILFLASVLLSLYMVGTLVWISSYSILAADDFSFGIIRVAENDKSVLSYISAGFDNVRHFYNFWQGTYFQVFLQSMINPVNGYGLGQLRILMAINALLFFVTLVFLIISIMKEYGVNDLLTISLIVTLIVFSICGYETYPEVFFWHSGSMGYSVPLSLLMIGIALLINDRATGLAAVLGFMSMGGSLTVSGTGCYGALILLLFSVIQEKKVSAKKLIVFFIWLAGALINALAPGNYIRHNSIDDSGLHLFDSIYNAIAMAFDRYNTLFSYNYLLILISVTIIGMVISHNVEVENDIIKRVIFSFCGLFTPIVSAFPVALGTEVNVAPNRCAFIIDVAIIISSVCFVFIFSIFVGSYFKIKVNRVVCIGLLVFAFIYCKYDDYGLSDFKTYELYCQQQLYDVYSDHYYTHVNFYKWVKAQKGQDVVVTPEHCPYGIDNVFNLYLFSDPNEWVNKCVAQYCEVKSIRVDYD